MTEAIINVFVTTFAGLGLPPTISIPVVASTPVSDFLTILYSRLPQISPEHVIITTSANKTFSPQPLDDVSSFRSRHGDPFVTLRMSSRLLGGKGGFGSQLRAAGGRMSSKRKKNQGENSGSNRNLDGRRLRTVTEAKALAEYLAVKPEMEKEERERRRKRWSEVVEMAEKRQEELESSSKTRVDGIWVEEKEEASERARDAVLLAIDSGQYTDFTSRLTDLRDQRHVNGELGRDFSRGSSPDPTGGSKGSTVKHGEVESSPSTTAKQSKPKIERKSFAGFDDEDEFFSDDNEASDTAEEAAGKS